MQLTDVVREVAVRHAIGDWTVFAFGGDTYVFLFLPYSPQSECKMMVDNYYPAYQRVRRARLDLSASLTEWTEKPIAYGYKGLTVLAGATRFLRNSLVAHPRYGSWFVMEGVAVEGVWADEVRLPDNFNYAMRDLVDMDSFHHQAAWHALCASRFHAMCEGCDRCHRACPNDAIGKSFSPEKCLRSLQSEGYVQDALLARRMGQRILGCHTCQLVCPVNHAPTVPAEVDGERLFEAALEGKRALMPYADCLGNNYLRPAKLVALGLNALGNAGDARYREQAVQARERFDDDRVRLAVDRYLAATPEVEREVKRMLSYEDYRTFARLAAAMGGRTATQINHYFYVGDFGRARIRQKGDDYTLTIKRRRDAESHFEHNAPLSAEVAEECLRTGLTPELVHRYLGFELSETAPYEGHLVTVRTTWRQEGLILELDDNTYLGHRDYEIECEVGSDAEWRAAEAFVQSHAPSATLGKGKQTRFEEALRQGK